VSWGPVSCRGVAQDSHVPVWGRAEGSSLITASVIQRTFHIRHGNLTGTAFAIDYEGRQYLITARHVLDGLEAGEGLSIHHGKEWQSTSASIVGVSSRDIDIIVLSLPLQIAPAFPLEASTEGMVFGRQVYFLGFPFGWDGGAEDINRDFPMPSVKAGFLSAITGTRPSRIYVDGHNNKGFSGGPLVFVPDGKPQNEFRLAGIVSNYPTPIGEPIVDERGNHILDETGKPAAYFRENPGFVVATNIKHAVELIEENPTGFELPM